MSKHRLHSDIGLMFATDWGREDSIGIDLLIRSMNSQDIQQCLLCATVTMLRHIQQELARIRLQQPPQDNGPHISQGMLAGLLATVPPPPKPPAPPDISLDKLGFIGLSVRAKKALRHAKFEMLSEITPASILGIRGCGKTTRNELLRWAHLTRENYYLIQPLQEPDNATDTTEHHDAPGTPGGSGVAPENGEETHATRTRHSAEGHDAGGTGFTPQASDPIHPCVPD